MTKLHLVKFGTKDQSVLLRADRFTGSENSNKFFKWAISRLPSVEVPFSEYVKVSSANELATQTAFILKTDLISSSLKTEEQATIGIVFSSIESFEEFKTFMVIDSIIQSIEIIYDHS